MKQIYNTLFEFPKWSIETLIKEKEPPETRLQRFERLTGYNPCRCPVCKAGRMVVINELPRILSPERIAATESFVSKY